MKVHLKKIKKIIKNTFLKVAREQNTIVKIKQKSVMMMMMMVGGVYRRRRRRRRRRRKKDA